MATVGEVSVSAFSLEVFQQVRDEMAGASGLGLVPDTGRFRKFLGKGERGRPGQWGWRARVRRGCRRWRADMARQKEQDRRADQRNPWVGSSRARRRFFLRGLYEQRACELGLPVGKNEPTEALRQRLPSVGA